MTWTHRQTRRSRYSGRRHEVETRPAPSPVPDEIEWKVRLGETVAHAYSSGPGWMRSVCRAERWTVLLADVVDENEVETCGDCALLVNGAPGEITEAFGS